MSITFTDYARHAVRHLALPGKIVQLLPWLILLLMVVGLVGCGDKESKPVVPPRPVRVVIAPAPVGASQFIESGEIRAADEVTLSFRQEGHLLTRTVDVGNQVAAGQVLATQESNTSRNQLESAQADLSSARAAEQVASLTLKRMKLLMPHGAIARSQLDTAQYDWQAALSRRQSSEDALKNARETLGWSRLIAPSSGVVTQVAVSAGQVVSAGQSIVTLAAGDGRDAVFDVADPQMLAQTANLSFVVSLLADPSISTPGHLRDISPQADTQTRTWRVRVTLDKPLAALALGASVQVAWQQAGQSMIALPAAALTRAGGNPAIFIVNRKSLQLHLRPVSLGRYSTEEIFISSGLQPGETVVVAGVSKLRQGERVTLGEASE
ncbi:MAG: efflux RND transporter periplasmic adaptor subunit [Rouxiella aceris]|uniref:efflux RND transporter periplasmic adaptor subunit n=1 Tax=Rouxiella aceris TaxID=2703884 RepID=UPI00284F677B|nr:efflux RND transporter periplasmic adaptor subunit [Rouxiella aceris]MDR3431288.1 efflux RND transporter periplasmic adaptor subunit [Rouxiella aceris]